MALLTLAAARPTIAKALGVCSADARIPGYVNEAADRLLQVDLWRGCYLRYRVCVNQNCLVWPRQLETIEAYAICESPGVVRNQWFDFLGSGFGLSSGNSGWAYNLMDRGEVSTYDEFNGTASKVRVYGTVSADNGQLITLQGYSATDGQWIRTFVSGEWIDGEQVVISTTPTLSVNQFMKPGPVRVIKPVTQGNVLLYEYDTVTGLPMKQIAQYEPDETLPLYRKSLLPGLDQLGNCNTCHTTADSCQSKYVTVMAKMRFVPVGRETDFCVIGNVNALKLEVMAVLKEERNLMPEAALYHTKAVGLLREELKAYNGSGVVAPIRVSSPDTFGAGTTWDTWPQWR